MANFSTLKTLSLTPFILIIVLEILSFAFEIFRKVFLVIFRSFIFWGLTSGSNC